MSNGPSTSSWKAATSYLNECSRSSLYPPSAVATPAVVGAASPDAVGAASPADVGAASPDAVCAAAAAAAAATAFW